LRFTIGANNRQRSGFRISDFTFHPLPGEETEWSASFHGREAI
jgi:hypothetical protein